MTTQAMAIGAEQMRFQSRLEELVDRVFDALLDVEKVDGPFSRRDGRVLC